LPNLTLAVRAQGGTGTSRNAVGLYQRHRVNATADVFLRAGSTLNEGTMKISPTTRFVRTALLTCLVTYGLADAACASTVSNGSDPNAAQHRAWIEAMKTAPRGPFERIRWFCKDGAVLAPKKYACADHGGGVQHGELTSQAKTLRERGYFVANVLADLQPNVFLGIPPDFDSLTQLVLERFLIEADGGWIFRGAYSYRGSLQAEDEEAAALAVVMAMLDDPQWRLPERFVLIRELVRLLPVQMDDVSASAIRQLALDIAEKDSGFTSLRIKIHGSPDASDADAVRSYAAAKGKADLQPDYAQLADAIDALYTPRGAVDVLTSLAGKFEDQDLAAYIMEQGEQIETAKTPDDRLRRAGYGMLGIRDRFEAGTGAADGLSLLLASLALERAAYAAGNSLVAQISGVKRREALVWLGRGAAAVYGAGFISKRELRGLATSIKQLLGTSEPTLRVYRRQLRYLSRITEWAASNLGFYFNEPIAKLVQIEPLAHLYIQDRLRGSPLLLCGAVIDHLVKDANRLAGVEHSLFGTRVGSGLRALNPGLARGVLYAPAGTVAGSETDASGIYLLPETTSDLPPVGGILTQGEGSSLSHVQLLARNLGIPNVVVGNEVLPEVRRHVGEHVVLAVSPNGVVKLERDGPQWISVFGSTKTADSNVVIRPDLEKLDVQTTDFVSLRTLRAADSGRISGPKGANLGELKHHFGDAVPGGFVIPFGAFRKQLDKPIEPGGPSVYEWMKQRYDEIAKLSGSPDKQQRAVSTFLERLRDWIRNTDQGPEFRAQLRGALEAEFGQDGTYGVFVRSDTNVEDLPGFTGAGLNQTIPNVVGFENILSAIREVWASPFTERAYSWRQAHMEDPEYVFPAVVVQYSFPAEKSGVMVTTDLDGEGDQWLSVAVSEGVGGAVDGQAAESLRISSQGDDALLLAQATSPYKRVLAPNGGVQTVRASGGDTVLYDNEIEQLRRLARDAPARFPTLQTAEGGHMAADIEFAFRGGRLALLQLRPFVENKGAQRNEYLNGLDTTFRERGETPVNLEAPAGS